MAVPEQSSPRFEINPLPARAAPAGAEPPLPPRPLSRPGAPCANPRLCTAAAANQTVGTALRPRLQPDLGKSPQKLFLFFFLFSFCKHPLSEIEVGGMKFGFSRAGWLGLEGSPPSPAWCHVNRCAAPGLLTCPLDPSDTFPSATLCMTAQQLLPTASRKKEKKQTHTHTKQKTCEEERADPTADL